MKWICILIFFMIEGWVRRSSVISDQHQDGEEAAREFMKNYDKNWTYWDHCRTTSNWGYESNITYYNMQMKLNVASHYDTWQREQWLKVIKFPWQSFQDPLLRRKFKKISVLGAAALPEDKRLLLDELITRMGRIYSATNVHKWDEAKSLKDNIQKSSGQQTKTVNVEPDLVNIFSSDLKDACKLQYYWQLWHESAGRKVFPIFKQYIDLANEAARLNNFSDNAAMWTEGDYDAQDFVTVIHSLYQRIRPLYEQLHAYVRRKLSLFLKNKDCVLIEEDGPLPAHVLGNLWAQQWDGIYEMTTPYPGKGSIDVTPAMRAMNYTPLKMFKLAEEFFTSLNLSPMTDTFWNKSIIEKPKDRVISCHASSWDFFTGEDFRIKMCTNVDFTDFKTIHHEMGHIQYYQQYKDQPQVFKEGANPGFHEAVGDTLALSASTPDHLMKIGLLDNKTYKADKEAEINALYYMALKKVAFLPYAYILDLWRWELFRGNTTLDNCNCRFWKLREELEGIIPPVDRSANDFDAGAKFHVIADYPYIAYFVSFIIQFQFHKALCIKAGQYNPKDPASKPLHRCDIYRSTEAGNALSSMLKLGSSKHWHYAMEALTGQQDMDAGPLLEYFQPLMDWLVKENKKSGEKIGWKFTSKINYCKSWASGRKFGKSLSFLHLLIFILVRISIHT